MGHKRVWLFMAAALTLTGLFALGVSLRASANTQNVFLNDQNGSNDLTLGIWRADEVNILLDAPKSVFQVYRKQSDPGNVTVTLKGICSEGCSIVVGWDGSPKSAASAVTIVFRRICGRITFSVAAMSSRLISI